MFLFDKVLRRRTFPLKLSISMLTLSALLLPTESLAGIFKDGPFVGYVQGGDVVDEDVAFGWQGVYEHDEHLSVEGAFSWQQDEDIRFSSSQPEVGDTPLDLQLLGFSLTGRIGSRPRENLHLYIGGGFTYYEIDGNTERIRVAADAAGTPPAGFFAVDFDKEWGGHFVLGLEVVLTRHWEVFAEYRQLYLQPSAQVRFAPDRDSPTISRYQKYSYDHSMLRFGLSYRF